MSYLERKIRIAYLIDTISSDKAGTEKQLLNVIQRLDREKFEVSLICLSTSSWMHENSLPCEVHSLGYTGFLKPGFPMVVIRYLRLLKDKKFDIVQTFFEDSIFVAYLGKLISSNRHAFVISRRDLGLGADEPGYHRIYRKILPFIMRSADAVTTNAKAIKSHLVQKCNVPEAKITVIGNGLDLPDPPRELPRLFSEHKDSLWLGIVANLKPVKRVDLLLRAVVQLKECETGNEVQAVILGDGRLRAELSRLAYDLGIADRVHFVGSVQNVSDYLYGIDIGVLCSDKEGLSNAILEYMACGLPVVATNAGGNSELVDETNGYCVSVGDSLAIAQALTSLNASHSLRLGLGSCSLEKVKRGFTWDKVMRSWEGFYASLVKAPAEVGDASEKANAEA